MNIQLKRMSLRNFKGIRRLDLDFGQETTIRGENATGKTTIFDAFTWLLFGKDTTGRSDFEIKTVDASGKPIHRLEHEVSATLEVSGMDVDLRRVYKEKWIKKRGAVEPEFNGHTEDFFYNDVPLSKGDYSAKIASILDENIFKLITNPLYFNSLKWQDRRQTLLGIAGDISDDEILNTSSNSYAGLLLEMLNAGKTIDEFKREIAAKKKKIKDELEMIPARIDELNRSCPTAQNWSALSDKIAEKQKELKSIETQLLDQSKAVEAQQKEKTNLQSKLFDLKQKQTEIVNEIKLSIQKDRSESSSDYRLKKQELSSLFNQKSALEKEFAGNLKRIEGLKAERETLIAKWQSENSKSLKFDENEFVCPACKREFEADDIEAKKAEMTKHFNEHKHAELADISKEGKGVKALIEDKEKRNEVLKSDIASFDEQILQLDQIVKDLETRENNQPPFDEITAIRLIDSTDYKRLKIEEKKLDEQLAGIKDVNPDAGLTKKKNIIQEIIYQLRDELQAKDQIEKIDTRIEELKDQESELASELAKNEGIEFTIQQFMKAKMDTLESRINDKFSLVKFRLFDQQINGGEKECCDTLVNGVNWIDSNNASKINSGLDVINVLCDHYDVTAPIFVDNSEAVNKLISVKSQLVKLVVTTDKKLKVETSKEQQQLANQ